MTGKACGPEAVELWFVREGNSLSSGLWLIWYKAILDIPMGLKHMSGITEQMEVKHIITNATSTSKHQAICLHSIYLGIYKYGFP